MYFVCKLLTPFGYFIRGKIKFLSFRVSASIAAENNRSSQGYTLRPHGDVEVNFPPFQQDAVFQPRRITIIGKRTRGLFDKTNLRAVFVQYPFDKRRVFLYGWQPEASTKN